MLGATRAARTTLNANAFFSLLPNRNVRALAREIRWTDLEKGEMLFEQGCAQVSAHKT